MSNIPYGTTTAVQSPYQIGEPTDPTAGVNSTIWSGTVNLDAALTALVHRTILDNMRDALRWMVPGSYRPGPGRSVIPYRWHRRCSAPAVRQ